MSLCDVAIAHNGNQETSKLPKKSPPKNPSQMACYWEIAWELWLTNINLCRRNGIVVRALHISPWATRKTRLNFGIELDQLLQTETVGQVKPSWQQNSEMDAHSQCHKN